MTFLWYGKHFTRPTLFLNGLRSGEFRRILVYKDRVFFEDGWPPEEFADMKGEEVNLKKSML